MHVLGAQKSRLTETVFECPHVLWFGKRKIDFTLCTLIMRAGKRKMILHHAISSGGLVNMFT